MGYTHVEIESAQSSRRDQDPCGDLMSWERTTSATTLICCDGIGSGVRANLAAHLCVSRLSGLIRSGLSLRQAFASVVHTMDHVRRADPPYPFAAFAVARVLNDGAATVLTYEIPGPVYISDGHAVVLAQRTVPLGHAVVGESHCLLHPGDALVLTSDGITQAGLGRGLAAGWTLDGACQYIGQCLRRNRPLKALPGLVLGEARRLSGEHADDCTVMLAACREGLIVNVLSGPPGNREQDAEVVRRFVEADGLKVVCGGTTASVVARETGVELSVEEDDTSLIAPPRYRVDGIDLVTEGAVTLNQVLNILDDDPADYDERSGVTDLASLLHAADRVNLTIGLAENPASSSIGFRQRGILARRHIVPLLADKLTAAGKLVVTSYV